MSRSIVILMALFVLLIPQVALTGTPMMDGAMGDPIGTAAPCHPVSPDAPSSDEHGPNLHAPLVLSALVRGLDTVQPP